MSQLRAWGASVLVTAVLVALTLWRSPPARPGQWALVAVIWLVGTAAVHLLLHNRWMRELDARSRARLAGWRSRRSAPGADGPARSRGARTGRAEAGAREGDPRGRPPRRGAGHATHKGVGVPWSANDTRAHPGRYHRRGRPLRKEPR